MGRPKRFEIELLNNPSGVYVGGQMIQGRLHLELDEPLTTRAIRMEYKGAASVRWTEQRSTGKTTYTVVFWSNEKYFSETQTLWSQAKDGAGSDELPKGMHTYPFQFMLPEGIPSSFEEKVGKVRYFVRGVIDRKFWFDYNTKKAFTVLEHLDLNTMPEAMTEVVANNHKYLCCLCCRNGPITGTLRVPRKGYVPGEAIVIDADIENLSSRKMAKTTVRIYQYNSFHATTKTKVENRIVAELKHGPIEARKSDTWRGDRLLVPSIPPSFLKSCRIIDVNYVLQLNVDPTGLGFDLKVPAEIVIGSIPLRQAVDQYSSMGFSIPTTPALDAQPALPSSDQVYGVLGPSTSAGGAAAAARPPPPTYTESVFGKVNIKDDDDDKENQDDNSYAPSYAYYNWGFESSQSYGTQ